MVKQKAVHSIGFNPASRTIRFFEQSESYAPFLQCPSAGKTCYSRSNYDNLVIRSLPHSLARCVQYGLMVLQISSEHIN
jgi:hypothetical protein